MVLISVIIGITIIPFIWYFPKIFIYFIMLESVLSVSIMPEDSRLNERQIIAALLLIFSLVKHKFMVKKLFDLHDKINVMLTIFFVWVGISFIFWGHNLYGSGEFFTLGYCIIMGILIRDNFQNEKNIRQLVIFMVFSGVVLALFAFGQFDVQVYNRLRGSREPNFTALSLVILLPFLFQKKICQGKVWPFIKMPIISLLLFAILLTGSRTGLIGLFSVVLFSAFANKDMKYRMQIVFFIFAVGITSLFVIEFTDIQFPDRLKTALFEPQEELSHGNFQYRLLRAKAALAMFQEKPVIGVGAGNYSVYAPFWGVRQGAAIYSAHNEYARLIAEFGLIGALIFGLFLYYIFRSLFKSLKVSMRLGRDERNSDLLNPLLTAIAISFVSFLIMNSALNSLLFSTNTYIFTALIQNLSVEHTCELGGQQK